MSPWRVPNSSVVRAGDRVHTHSGLPPVNSQTCTIDTLPIDQQTRRVLDHIKACLDAANSGFDRIVKCTIYCSNPACLRRSARSTSSNLASIGQRVPSSVRRAGSGRSTSRWSASRSRASARWDRSVTSHRQARMSGPQGRQQVIGGAPSRQARETLEPGRDGGAGGREIDPPALHWKRTGTRTSTGRRSMGHRSLHKPCRGDGGPEC